MRNVIDQITGNEQNTNSFSDVTRQYRLSHNELDTSFRLADFEQSIRKILQEQLQKENIEAINRGDNVSQVVELNNFENDAQSKFYKNEIEELIGNVNNMNVEEIKVHKKRMAQLMESLESSDAEEKDFLREQIQQSQDYLEQELQHKNSISTRVAGSIDEALDNYGQIESLALGLVDHNPIAAVGVRMLTSWYKRNRERQKNTRTELEAQEHRQQMAIRNEQDQAENQEESARNTERLDALREEQINAQLDSDDEENNNSFERDPSEAEQNLQQSQNRPQEEVDEDEPNRAEEIRELQEIQKERKRTTKFQNTTAKWQKKHTKLVKSILIKTKLIEKHTLKISKKKNKRGVGVGVGGGLGNALKFAAPALAVAGAGAFGYMIGEGFNSLIEETTGDTVGGNIFNILNNNPDKKDLSKKEKAKHKELNIEGTDYDLGNFSMNALDDKEIIDFDKIGYSKVEDWGKLAKQPIHTLKAIYAYDDFSPEDKERLAKLIIKTRDDFSAIQQAKRAKNKKAKQNRNNSKSIAPAAAKGIGSVSEQYESGGRGAGTISSGRGDPGGVSYGTYQLASKTGTLQKYIDQSQFKDQLTAEINSPEFKEQWKKLAKDNPEFGQDQHDFIKKTHYDPVEAEYRKQTGNLDGEIPKSIQEALWSQGVQHSGAGNKKIISNSLQGLGPDASEADKVKSLYGSRSNYVAGLGLPGQTEASLQNRYVNEQQDALSLVGQGSLVANTPPSTELINQIDSTKTEIDNSKAQIANKPIVVANNTTNQSSGGGGGGSSGSSIPLGARNNETANQRITDRIIAGGMV